MVRSFCLLATALVLSASAVEIDGVVARVGEESILRSEVYNEMRRMGEQDVSAYDTFLRQLIDRKLILKAASAAKMTMQEWIVENRIREIINNAFGGDRNKLIEALAKQKVSYPEWRTKTKEDMVVGAMRWNVVDKNVSASPSALKREYETHRDRYVRGGKVTVAVILLKPEEKAKRGEISAALKEKSFEDLGGRVYKDINPAETFKPEVVEEIAKMPRGTISHWIEIDGWSFLLRKDAEEKGRELSFDEAYDEVEAAVKESEAKRLYEAWLKRLWEESYIKVF